VVDQVHVQRAQRSVGVWQLRELQAELIRRREHVPPAVVGVAQLDHDSVATFNAVCDELAPAFAAIPGLISKVWLSNAAANTYGGVYTWRDRAAFEAFAQSDLARAVATHPNFTGVTIKDFGVLEGPTRSPEASPRLPRSARVADVQTTRRLGDMVSERALAELAGREHELETLLGLFEPEGPLVAYVHGVAGIGKSSLVDAFATHARQRGVRVIRI